MDLSVLPSDVLLYVLFKQLDVEGIYKLYLMGVPYSGKVLEEKRLTTEGLLDLWEIGPSQLVLTELEKRDCWEAVIRRDVPLLAKLLPLNHHHCQWMMRAVQENHNEVARVVADKAISQWFPPTVGRITNYRDIFDRPELLVQLPPHLAATLLFRSFMDGSDVFSLLVRRIDITTRVYQAVEHTQRDALPNFRKVMNWALLFSKAKKPDGSWSRFSRLPKAYRYNPY